MTASVLKAALAIPAQNLPLPFSIAPMMLMTGVISVYLNLSSISLMGRFFLQTLLTLISLASLPPGKRKSQGFQRSYFARVLFTLTIEFLSRYSGRSSSRLEGLAISYFDSSCSSKAAITSSLTSLTGLFSSSLIIETDFIIQQSFSCPFPHSNLHLSRFIPRCRLGLALACINIDQMLKEKIVIVDVSKKSKIVSEVSKGSIQETFYEKIKLIGQGTFGKVYLARGKKDGRQWALKEVLQDRRYKNRELSIIARVEHSNIITMKEYFLKLVRDECYLSMIMDYIPSSLNLLIKEQRKAKKPFAPVLRKLMVFQLFKALYYMQLTKICHRDLKPPNILVNDETYELKVCDFGSAKILEKQESNVSYICSRYYRAPELVMQATDYGTEIDVWSAGCIVVELLTLQPIFPGDSSQEQLIEIMKILGTPPQKYIDLYQEEKSTHYNFPVIKPSPWQVILHKYQPEKELVDLISRMLTYDTQVRIKPVEVLKHPYFWDLHEYPACTAKLPLLFYFSDLENSTNSKQIDQLQKLYPRPQPQLKEKTHPASIGEQLKSQTTPITCPE